MRQVDERIDELQELKEKVEFYEYILNGIEVAVYINQPSGKQVWSNRYAEEFIGMNSEEVTEYGAERFMLEKFHIDDFELFADSAKHFSNPKNNTFTAIYRQKNAQGEWRKLLGNTTIAKRNPDGSIVEGIGVLIDVTDRFDSDKQIESILKENNRLKYSLKLASLSKREKQVFTMLGNHISIKEISKKLSISKHTVISHKKNIMKKLKINSLTKMVEIAANCGL